MSDRLEQLEHLLPAVHAAPADLALGGEPLAVVLRRSSQASRKVSAIVCVLPAGSSAQVAGPTAESMRTTPSGRTPSSRSFLAIRQALRTCVEEAAAAPRRSPIAEPPPVGGQTGADQRADHQVPRPGPSRPARFRSSSVASMSTCGREEEQVDAVELDSVDLGGGGQVEHRVEVDGRLGVRPLADHTGPDGVVELRKLVGMGIAHRSVLLFEHCRDPVRGAPLHSGSISRPR